MYTVFYVLSVQLYIQLTTGGDETSISKTLTNPPHEVTLLEGTIRLKTIFKSIPLITIFLTHAFCTLHADSSALTRRAVGGRPLENLHSLIQ